MKNRLLWLIVLLSTVYSIQLAAAQDPISDSIAMFKNFDTAVVYLRFQPFLDFIAYAVLFIGVAQFALKKQFGEQPTVPTIIGVVFAVGTAVFARTINFKLSDLGPFFLALGLLVIFYTIYQTMAGLGVQNTTSRLLWAFVVVMAIAIPLAKNVFASQLATNPWLASIFGFLQLAWISALLLVIIGLFSFIFGGGAAQPQATANAAPAAVGGVAAPAPAPGQPVPPPGQPVPPPGQPPQPQPNMQAFNQFRRNYQNLINNGNQILTNMRNELTTARQEIENARQNNNRAANSTAALNRLTALYNAQAPQANSPYMVVAALIANMQQQLNNNAFVTPQRRTAVQQALTQIRTRVLVGNDCLGQSITRARGYIPMAVAGQNIRWTHTRQNLDGAISYINQILNQAPNGGPWLQVIGQAINQGP